VTTADVTIPADQNAGEIEISAATDAPATKSEAIVTAKIGATSATSKIPVVVEKAQDR
jgi:hypothetical protein